MIPRLTRHRQLFLAEKKDSADGKIEVINYATKTIIDQFDFSEEMMPHKVAFDGNMLKVSAPECQGD